MAGSLKEVLAQQGQKRADLRQAQYVRPRGLGLHLVLLLPDRTPIIVGAAAGSTTWARSAIVLLGSVQGSRQLVILGNPAPGLGGGAAFAESVSHETLDTPSIQFVAPTDLPVGATSTLYVVGLLLRTGPAFDRWDLVYRPTPEGELVLDPFGFVLLAEAVPDPEAVGLSLSGDQVAVALQVEVAADCPLGHSFTLRMRR